MWNKCGSNLWLSFQLPLPIVQLASQILRHCPACVSDLCQHCDFFKHATELWLLRSFGGGNSQENFCHLHCSCHHFCWAIKSCLTVLLATAGIAHMVNIRTFSQSSAGPAMMMVGETPSLTLPCACPPCECELLWGKSVHMMQVPMTIVTPGKHNGHNDEFLLIVIIITHKSKV